MNAGVGATPVFILGGTVLEVTKYARHWGIAAAVAVTETGQLDGFRGHRFIVLPGYIRSPRHAEILVAARVNGLDVRWES